MATMRTANFEKVLHALGVDHDQFIRMAAVEWDGSMEAELRLKLLQMLEPLGREELLRAHHLLTELVDQAEKQARKAKPAGRRGVGVEPINPPKSQAPPANRKSG